MNLRYVAVAAFVLTIPAANWMIQNVGDCRPGGPCLIPVGFGLNAPSGVLLIGLALVLRDVVHRLLGWRVVIGAIVLGAAVTHLVATPALALASVTAFVLSELVDLAVYAPLQRKRLVAAVLLSGIAGAFVDSAVFLYIAFDSLDYTLGNAVGKIWMSVLAIPLIWRLRENHAR